ncbi:hypothetical protein Pfo_028106 [Paulownia fortunei]|nr:hypothetical protein Pfo_028106 [Paulownia fortunei]
MGLLVSHCFSHSGDLDQIPSFVVGYIPLREWLQMLVTKTMFGFKAVGDQKSLPYLVRYSSFNLCFLKGDFDFFLDI